MAFTQDSNGSVQSDEQFKFTVDSPDFDSFEHLSDADDDHFNVSISISSEEMEVDRDVDNTVARRLADVDQEIENAEAYMSKPLGQDQDEESNNGTDSQVENEERRDVVHDSETLNAIRLGQHDEQVETNEYQTQLRIYVNRCIFIRSTLLGKHAGFAPSLPKTKTFYMCWTCDDWIPAGTSPICIPYCSNLHLSSKYVFERMFGLFCSWGCCKKYIHMCMSLSQRTKYMRSLHVLRRLFCPEIAHKPIENIEPRTEMNSWGGPQTPQQYYSKIVKVNLCPLPEDTVFWQSRQELSADGNDDGAGVDAELKNSSS